MEAGIDRTRAYVTNSVKRARREFVADLKRVATYLGG
jgi:hypothetical protein